MGKIFSNAFVIIVYEKKFQESIEQIFDESIHNPFLTADSIFLKQRPPPNSLPRLIFFFKDTQGEERFAIKEPGKSLERGLRKDNVCGYGTTRFSFAALRVGQIFWEQRRGVRGRRETLVDFAGEARGGHGVVHRLRPIEATACGIV